MKRIVAAIVAIGVLAPATSALSQSPPAPAQRRQQAEAGPAAATPPGRNGPAANQPSAGLPPLPAESTTTHALTLPDRTLNFTATAGAIRLSDQESGAARADVAYIAFRKTDADPQTRPVAFVFNGGPGSASGWLNVGALGPWRLPMSGDADRPSATAAVVDNADTWLDFTDLVFIDPPGTGYSRVIGGDDTRKALWSVNGDVNAVATTIRRWSESNDRMLSPKFIVGESYGGIRAPKVASQLQTDQGVGIKGLALISPALDYSWLRSAGSVMGLAARLPSMAAAKRERERPITRADLRDVEEYASGAYIADLMKGPNDKAAVARLSDRVAEFTGLDKAFVMRLAGRVPVGVWAREFNRDSQSISSRYDASLLGLDADPFGPRGDAPDQLAAGLNAPVIEAMVDMYHRKLKWNVENGRYVFANNQAARQWDFGRGVTESVSDLRKALALDPSMRVLIAQGLTDTAVPYYMTKLIIDQMPLVGPPDRMPFKVYPGGHMMYTRDASRLALRADAKALFEGK